MRPRPGFRCRAKLHPYIGRTGYLGCSRKSPRLRGERIAAGRAARHGAEDQEGDQHHGKVRSRDIHIFSAVIIVPSLSTSVLRFSSNGAFERYEDWMRARIILVALRLYVYSAVRLDPWDPWFAGPELQCG